MAKLFLPSYNCVPRMNQSFITICIFSVLASQAFADSKDAARGAQFFETAIRPLLVEHCYECHSEASGMRKGGLLLDRESGWLKGGDTENAVVPGEPDSSLLMKAIRYSDSKLQMPPDYQLEPSAIAAIERWVRLGAPGPVDDMGQTEFSRLGDQTYLFGKAKDHWAFHAIADPIPPEVNDSIWNRNPIDKFVFAKLETKGLTPSRMAAARTIVRRLSCDLSGLPPTPEAVRAFEADFTGNRMVPIRSLIDDLLKKKSFGEHIGRMWLDVARYADTESTYRADTKTPHYLPFAFSYRDYVIDAFNEDKPYDRFIREQLAADLLGLSEDAPELAALGFLSIGPHRRNSDNAIDDHIDVTTRGLMGLSVACARCHDHKFEPVPTADYYSLHGVFASIIRPNPLNEKAQPILAGYRPQDSVQADYERARAKIEKEIDAVGDKKSRNNRRSVAEKIRETKLAELLLFHEGAPARAMVVNEARTPASPFVYIRGERSSRGESVPRRFLKVLDSEQSPFARANSGRLDLAAKITSSRNPLTARVFVNRVWGFLMGDHLVDTPSDFGLQGKAPSHPELLDWLAGDFIAKNWSVKRLVRQIVTSRTYLQESVSRASAAEVDPENQLFWRANRRHLSIEALRDSLLFTSGSIDPRMHGHPVRLWGEDHSIRRSVYGYINRFNLDPTLRAFDFPSAMHTAGQRGESIVAQQALFTMNSPFVVARAEAISSSAQFNACETDEQRVEHLFACIFQRAPFNGEKLRAIRLVSQQKRYYENPWPLVAQALYMSNEFQYVD